LAREVTLLPEASRGLLEQGLTAWLTAKLEPLEPLTKLAAAARDPEATSEARALLHTLIAGHGVVSREDAGLQHLPKETRPFLRRLGVTFGALDVFAPALLKPAPRQLLHALGVDKRALQEAMLPFVSEAQMKIGEQAIRVDLAEKILRAAFDARAKAANADSKFFRISLALGISIGLDESNLRRLLQSAGFKLQRPPALAEGAFGPPQPESWNWKPRRPGDRNREPNRRNRPNKQGTKGGKRPANAKGGKGKTGGKPPHKGKRPDRQKRKIDHGPARASGAFDALKDLIK